MHMLIRMQKIANSRAKASVEYYDPVPGGSNEILIKKIFLNICLNKKKVFTSDYNFPDKDL